MIDFAWVATPKQSDRAVIGSPINTAFDTRLDNELQPASFGG
jgi:hypothetical protein